MSHPEEYLCEWKVIGSSDGKKDWHSGFACLDSRSSQLTLLLGYKMNHGPNRFNNAKRFPVSAIHIMHFRVSKCA